jgi:hypothetical protein
VRPPDTIEQYAAKHPRAARYLASIRGQEEMKNIDKAALKKLCKRPGIDVYADDTALGRQKWERK